MDSTHFVRPREDTRPGAPQRLAPREIAAPARGDGCPKAALRPRAVTSPERPLVAAPLHVERAGRRVEAVPAREHVVVVRVELLHRHRFGRPFPTLARARRTFRAPVAARRRTLTHAERWVLAGFV